MWLRDSCGSIVAARRDCGARWPRRTCSGAAPKSASRAAREGACSIALSVGAAVPAAAAASGAQRARAFVPLSQAGNAAARDGRGTRPARGQRSDPSVLLVLARARCGLRASEQDQGWQWRPEWGAQLPARRRT